MLFSTLLGRADVLGPLLLRRLRLQIHTESGRPRVDSPLREVFAETKILANSRSESAPRKKISTLAQVKKSGCDSNSESTHKYEDLLLRRPT
jgi:hypothetical protein